jgi:DNA (cytosine-5)-methyltransferase 1
MHKVVSLFSGAGGADLGMVQAGLNVIFANDNYDWAIKTYEANFGTCVWPTSIQYLNADDVPDCDVIIGGPPCQSFSNARTQARETLRTSCGLDNVRHMKRIVTAKQPKLFVCENIITILDQSMLHAYTEFKHWPGYRVTCYKLNAEDYGVPQTRERLFFCGVRDDLVSHKIVFHKPIGMHWSKLYSGISEYLSLPAEGFFLKRANGRERVPAIGKPFYTITTADNPVWRYGEDCCQKNLMTQVRLLMGIEQRYLTIQEKAWLQGFPTEFEFFGGKVDINRQIGNAWCVNVARALGKEIKRCLDEYTTLTV